MGARFVIAAVLIVGGCSSHDDEVTRGRCEKVRDHLIDLRLQDASGQSIDIEAHRRAMKQAIGDGFVSACLQHMTATQVRCTLDAHDSAAANACSLSASSQTASK